MIAEKKRADEVKAKYEEDQKAILGKDFVNDEDFFADFM